MSHRKPVVSIITPFLNAEPFLEESIESVLAQTYDTWELHLIDDGSSDGGTAVARRYAAAYPEKIRYHHHEGHRNLGGSRSRNLGISHAKGKYIAFLDADDVYLPHKLEDQILLLESQPDAVMLYAATEYWYGWTGREEDARCDWVWRNFGVPPGTLVAPPRLLTSFLNGGGTVPCMGSLLVRRDAIERVGGFEDSFLNQYDDQVLYAKLCLESPVFVADGCWDKYRQHPNSSCYIAKQTGEADCARVAYLQWLESYIREKNISDISLWKALRKALRPYRRPVLNRIVNRTKDLEGKLINLGASASHRLLPSALRRWLRSRWR